MFRRIRRSVRLPHRRQGEWHYPEGWEDFDTTPSTSTDDDPGLGLGLGEDEITQYHTSPEQSCTDEIGIDDQPGSASEIRHAVDDQSERSRSTSTSTKAGQDLPPRYEDIYLDSAGWDSEGRKGSFRGVSPDSRIIDEMTGGSTRSSSRSTGKRTSKYTRSSTGYHAYSGSTKSKSKSKRNDDIFAGMPSMSSTMTYGYPSYPHSPYTYGSYAFNNPYIPQPQPLYGYQHHYPPPQHSFIPPQPRQHPQFPNPIRPYPYPIQLAPQPNEGTRTGITYVPHGQERSTAQSTESYPFPRPNSYSHPMPSHEDTQIDPEDIIVYPSSTTHSTLTSCTNSTNRDRDYHTMPSASFDFNLNLNGSLPRHLRDISNGSDEATRHRRRYEFSMNLSFSADDPSEFADGLGRIREGLEGIEGVLRGRR